jgi:hypothetical protein
VQSQHPNPISSHRGWPAHTQSPPPSSTPRRSMCKRCLANIATRSRRKRTRSLCATAPLAPSQVHPPPLDAHIVACTLCSLRVCSTWAHELRVAVCRNPNREPAQSAGRYVNRAPRVVSLVSTELMVGIRNLVGSVHWWHPETKVRRCPSLGPYHHAAIRSRRQCV